MQILTRGRGPIVAMFAALVAVSGCSQSTSSVSDGLSAVKSMVLPARTYGYRASEKERECLARAMFFESNRSSRDGLVAVGSVVMNRKESGKWGDDICDVVGAKKQFAPGVLSRPMNSKALPDVMAAADDVLKGERHPKVTKDVMFFHTAGLKFPYKNMRYTTVAGGNAFYYKAGRKQDRLPVRQDDSVPGLQPVMVAEAEQPKPEVSGLPGVAVDAIPAVQPVQVAYAGDTPNAKKPVRTSLFGKRKTQPVAEAPVQQPVDDEQAAQPADEVQIALADEAPIPVDRVEPAAELQPVAFADEAGASNDRAPGKPKRMKDAKRQPAAASQAMMAEAPAYEAPASERFGGDVVQPAYAGGNDSGMSFGDGMGTGVLGQLVIESN